MLAYRQPNDLKEFLIRRLEHYKKQGLRGGVYTEAEIINVFNLFDLKKEGVISKDRCVKGNNKIKYNNIIYICVSSTIFHFYVYFLFAAIQTMANSSFQFTSQQLQNISDSVDVLKFKEICDNVLGLTKESFFSDN